MTDRPMTDGLEEAEPAFKITDEMIEAAAKAYHRTKGTLRHRPIKWEKQLPEYRMNVRGIMRSILIAAQREAPPTSAAVRGMREALERARRELYDALHSHMSEAAFLEEVDYIDAVLSGIETEHKQARSPSALSAPISTDTKGTTK